MTSVEDDHLEKEHLFLGKDEHDLKSQMEHWLAVNPSVTLATTSGIRKEPVTLLTRFGGRCVPRVSMLVRYQEKTASSEAANRDFAAGRQSIA
jgi:hypothetical protein